MKLLTFCRFSVISQFCKIPVAQYESDMLSVVNSLILSINETDLQIVKSSACNASCIRFSLVKLLRRSGYDAAVCATKWQGIGKVPGGMLVNSWTTIVLIKRKMNNFMRNRGRKKKFLVDITRNLLSGEFVVTMFLSYLLAIFMYTGVGIYPL